MTNQAYNDVDIARAWQKMADEKFNQLTIKKDDIMTAITQESKSSIAELKRRLKYKLYWTVFFTVAFSTFLLFNLGNPDLILLTGIIVASYVVAFFAMFFKYRQINESQIEESDLLKSVKHNAKLIKSVLKFEKAWGAVVFIPIIFISIFGGMVIKGHSLAETINDPKILTIGIIMVTVMTPLLLWATQKMNNYAFGNLIKKLEENIIKMETLK